MTLSFIEHLETALREAPPKQKGQRTRERLKIATARVLEQKGYHSMRVSDVSEAAEVAEGSFYVYFNDKTDAALTVLTEFLEGFVNLDAGAKGGEPFESIRTANRRWFSVCRANAGLMRCILQLGDEEPEFARLSQRSNRIWSERVARGARAHSAAGAAPARLAAYMLGGMVDEMVRKLLIYPDPEFHALLKELGADDNAVADAASVVWLKIFHPGLAAPDDLPSAAAGLAEWMTSGS